MPAPVQEADARSGNQVPYRARHQDVPSGGRCGHPGADVDGDPADIVAAAAGRAVAWVSAEGVGVAPTIPTLGDRRASGHSIIGLAVFDRSALRAEAIGRCWSQGRLLAWLADS
jgi:Uncharacterized protein conserved in bacteria (DUF2332)